MEVKVAFSYRLILHAEVLSKEIQDGSRVDFMLISSIIGDKFQEQTEVINWSFVQDYTFVASIEHVAFIGGRDEEG